MANVEKIVKGVILVIVAIIVVFTLIASTSSDLIASADNISSSGLPLASMFGSSGVLLLIFMVGIFLAIMAMVFKVGKKGK